MKDALLQPSIMPDFKENFGLYLSVAMFNKLYFLLGIDYSTEKFVFLNRREIDLYAIFTLNLVIKTHSCADNCYLKKLSVFLQ